jgi:DNA repair exonuclease SbcCD ATPase subunit
MVFCESCTGLQSENARLKESLRRMQSDADAGRRIFGEKLKAAEDENARLKEELEETHRNAARIARNFATAESRVSDLEADLKAQTHETKRLEEAYDDLRTDLEAKLAEVAVAQGHDEPCFYCKEPCDSFAGNPGKWPIPLCHADDPGRVKWHHVDCVTDRLRNGERAERAEQESKTALDILNSYRGAYTLEKEAKERAEQVLAEAASELELRKQQLSTAEQSESFQCSRAIREQERAVSLERGLAQTAARLERIDLIGGQMANVMYNWRQDDKRFTERERKMMDDLQAAWDAALRELTHG